MPDEPWQVLVNQPQVLGGRVEVVIPDSPVLLLGGGGGWEGVGFWTDNCSAGVFV